MNIKEEEFTSYRNCKGKKLKSQRGNISKYHSLLLEAERHGIISIKFDENFSYQKRIQILKKITEMTKAQK